MFPEMAYPRHLICLTLVPTLDVAHEAERTWTSGWAKVLSESGRSRVAEQSVVTS